MGVRLVVEVLDCYHGPPRHKLWLLALAESANDKSRQGWPTREELARRAGVSQSRASHIATALEGEHAIKRIGTPGKHRGRQAYELLAVVHSQGAIWAHPEESVDNESQGAELPHPEQAVSKLPQGAVSASQGAVLRSQGALGNSQGAASSRGPAETPLSTPQSPQNYSPHKNSPHMASRRGSTQASRTNLELLERSKKIKRVLEAAIEVYGNSEDLSDEDAIALHDYLIADRKVTAPVRYLVKVFTDTPDVGTLIAPATDAEGEECCRTCWEPLSACTCDLGQSCPGGCNGRFTSSNRRQPSGLCTWCDARAS
jgi:hypothetical protein